MPTLTRFQDDPLEELVRIARAIAHLGLVRGTSGNVSLRLPGEMRFAITPSGVEYGALGAADAVIVDGEGHRFGDGLKPSSDTPIHAAVYRTRADVGAIVHTHSPYAAAFSTLPAPIPPILAEVAGFLGGPVRPVEGLVPGSPDAPERVATGLGAERAVLLPNHGVLAVGETGRAALRAAELVEESAQVAWLALQIGRPREVPEAVVRRLYAFLHEEYGQGQ